MPSDSPEKEAAGLHKKYVHLWSKIKQTYLQKKLKNRFDFSKLENKFHFWVYWYILQKSKSLLLKVMNKHAFFSSSRQLNLKAINFGFFFLKHVAKY